ncbi:CPBP family intramembrane glutamic endopeptidase [Phyllobacterium phragmitis]|nr:CPBP family intramembrane glutamic endopeptidase [Phyllobacterium phragmitis]
MSRIKSFLFCLILYIVFTVLLERESWKSAFQLPVSLSVPLKGAGFALALGAIALFLPQALGLLDIKSATLTYPEMAATVLAWLIAQVFNATKEEFIFRGYILRRLAATFNVHAAVIVSSLVFGAGHIAQYHFAGFVFAATAGIIFGYLYIFYRNIWIPIGFHGVWDIMSHTVLGRFFDVQAGPLAVWFGGTAGSAQIAFLVGLNVIFLICFFIWKRLWLLPPHFDGSAQRRRT